MSIFNVSNEEAKRIRLLHEEESKNKKISSSLNEAAAGMCGGNHPCTGPSGKSVSWQGCPGSPNLLNPLPCAMIDGQTPNSSHIGKYVGLPNIGFCGKVTSINNHTLPSGSVSCPPTGLVLGTDCDNCYTTTGGATSWDCGNNGTCVVVQGTGGQYSTEQDCIDDCNPPEMFMCDNDLGTCFQDPNGQYSSMSACQANCRPNKTWNCTKMGHCLAVNNSSGQYNTEQDCLQNCEKPTYNCKWVSGDAQGKKANPNKFGDKKRNLQEQVPISGYQCVPHQGSGIGQYPNLQACQAVCGEEVKRNYCVNCEKQQMRYYPGMPNGSQTSCGPGYVDIGPNPSPSPGPCFDCETIPGSQNTQCLQGQGWSGPYNSIGECQNGTPTNPACQTTLVEDYECVNGQCTIQSGGQFNSGPTTQDNLNACNAVCGIPNLWECDNGPNGCTQTPNGTYQTQGQCETACCQDVVNSYGWAINHPNATSAQACNRIFNQFGILGSFNPNTLPFDDGCEYDYLIAIAGVCGVSQNYQNLITGFIGGNNGCYGNPNAQNQGYGQGNPHQNSACGKVLQFCEAPIGNNPGPSTPTEWYKCQWTQQTALNGGCIC